MPLDIQAAARAVVDHANGRKDWQDERDTLAWQERSDYLHFDSVRLLIPLRDPVEVRRHLQLAIGVMTELCATLERMGDKDKTYLLTAQARLRRLSQQLNVKRMVTRGRS